MPDDLSCLAAGIRKPEPVDGIVQPAFEQNQEVRTGNASLAFCFFKVAFKLLFDRP